MDVDSAFRKSAKGDSTYRMEDHMVDLKLEQCEAVSGGFVMEVIAITMFMCGGGYRGAVDFTSGAIEGFMEAGA